MSTENPIGRSEPDNLYAGYFPEAKETRTIPADTEVRRGDILGADFKPIISGGTVDCIALDDITASSAIRVCTVSETGMFNINALSTGDNTTPEDWKADLRKLQIHLRHPAP